MHHSSTAGLKPTCEKKHTVMLLFMQDNTDQGVGHNWAGFRRT